MTPELHVFDIPTTTRFRGLTRRQGIVWEGPAGWAEWSPFPEYGIDEAATWLKAAREMADVGFPAPVRDRVPVNATVPALAPEAAYALVAASSCATAKVKVAEPRRPLSDDIDRVAAVRSALGSRGKVRVDANGAWTVAEALEAIGALRPYDLEYVEQPCRTTEELAELRLALARRGWNVRIAADESIRRTGDPERVVELEAADIAVLKVQPLGGVRACLDLAERLGLPVVVSSALETSVGLAAGLALAAALPTLDFACGLNTSSLLASDVTRRPLVVVAGEMDVAETSVSVEADLLDAGRAAPDVVAAWQGRLAECALIVGAQGSGGDHG